MRRLWPVVAATVLMLAGCGEDDRAAEAGPGTATAATAATAAGSSPEGAPAAGATVESARAGAAGFVSVVRERLPEVAVDRRDDEIAAVAGQACASLAAGDDAETVVAGTRSLGTADAEAVDHATARELIKLAIDTVCPDQDRRVDEF